MQSPVPFREADEDLVTQELAALSKTKNNTSPGLYGITYRLIELIKDTELGMVLIHDIARGVSGQVQVPRQHRSMSMVMIPKPRKNRIKVNG